MVVELMGLGFGLIVEHRKLYGEAAIIGGVWTMSARQRRREGGR
jgi:hypothetical protein